MLTYQKKQSNLESYRSHDVNTANRLKLLIMLYEGAIRFAKQAEQAIVAGDMAGKGEMIGKVMAIIDELQSTLDHSKAPEIARNLDRIYDFTRDRLVRANLKNDAKLLHEAMGPINTLLSAWVEVSKMPASELTTTGPDGLKSDVRHSRNPNEQSYVRLSV